MKHILLILSILLSPQAHAATLAFITNQGDNSVSVVDIVQHRLLKNIAVGKAPVGVVSAVKRGLVYISNVDSQDISVIDVQQLRVIDHIAVGGSPVGLALSPDEKQLFVAGSYFAATARIYFL